MVVSSHDFTATVEPESRDWGRYQILNAHDMTITGCKWVDIFLSAGLSEHRAHHVYPYQRSGFSNIHSTDILEEVAKIHKIKWEEPKNFFTYILPLIWKMYIWAPVADPLVRKPIYKSFYEEHTNLAVYKYMAGYIAGGLIGIGSM